MLITTIPALQTGFYRRFLDKMSEHVQTAETKAHDKVELSEEKLPTAVANIVLTAAKVSGAAVGGALAVSIASEIGKEMDIRGIQARVREEAVVDWGQPKDNPELDDLWSSVKSRSKAPDDTGIVRVSQGPDSPMAFFGDVIFSDKSLRHFESPAQIAMALGHEVAHLENQDSKASVGLDFLIDSLDTKDMNAEPMLLPLGKVLKELIKEENHRQEKTADKRGLEIAVALGHNPKEAVAFLAGRPEGFEHPSGDTRIEALRAEGFAV